MINDLIIIKDGVPLLSKSMSHCPKSVFSKQDSLVLVSGFFSALNSFSDQFEDLGAISEMKLSNNNLKVLFFRDPQITNMFYLATFDESSNSVDVKRLLRKISTTFLNKYGKNKILSWNGQIDSFKSFERIIERMAYKNSFENIDKENERKTQLLNSNTPSTNCNEGSSLDCLSLGIIHKDLTEKVSGSYQDLKPIPKFSKKFNPKSFLTGDTSLNIFNQINGHKTILEIAQNLNMSPEVVFNICKNLVKLGFIAL